MIRGFGTLRESEVTAYIPVLLLTAKHITKDELNSLAEQCPPAHPERRRKPPSSEGRSSPMLNPAKQLRKLWHDPPTTSPEVKKSHGSWCEDNPDNMTTVRHCLRMVRGPRVTDAAGGAMAKSYLPTSSEGYRIAGMNGMKRSLRFESTRDTAYPCTRSHPSAMVADRETILPIGRCLHRKANHT